MYCDPIGERKRGMALELAVRRIILFTNDMEAMVAFYRDSLGLALVTDEPNWKDLDGGSIRIALHNGSAMVGRRAPKIAFHAADVPAAREELLARGLKLGALIRSNAGPTFFDGKDPDGNPLTVSDRE